MKFSPLQLYAEMLRRLQLLAMTVSSRLPLEERLFLVLLLCPGDSEEPHKAGLNPRFFASTTFRFRMTSPQIPLDKVRLCPGAEAIPLLLKISSRRLLEVVKLGRVTDHDLMHQRFRHES